jgi:transcriptional regulator with XRE-family HTH domain
MDLVTARAREKKTQWDIRLATGIHQSKLSLIERGYIAPSSEEKEAIAGALGIAADEIQWPRETLDQFPEAFC